MSWSYVPIALLMMLLGCVVACSAVQTTSQSWKRAIPFKQASSDGSIAANAVLKQSETDECLRGKLSNAIVQLSNSCDVAGLEMSVCLMASSIAGEENELSMEEMVTTSTQLLLMLEPSTTST